jgi:hypothetical protein
MGVIFFSVLRELKHFSPPPLLLFIELQVANHFPWEFLQCFLVDSGAIEKSDAIFLSFFLCFFLRQGLSL